MGTRVRPFGRTFSRLLMELRWRLAGADRNAPAHVQSAWNKASRAVSASVLPGGVPSLAAGIDVALPPGRR
jgi:hypothetical protein